MNDARRYRVSPLSLVGMINGENVQCLHLLAVVPDQMPLQKNLYNLISLYMVSLTQPK